MEFVSVRDLRIYTGKVWEKLEKEKDLIVTSNGRPVALMTGISSSNLEEILAAVRRTRAGWIIRKMRKTAQKRGSGRMTLKEIDNEIKKARMERRS
ncbi:MAG: type II toxin-antitoxin system Phd/YefM family antitoxin [Deltaproteobacteria bacterium]|nr:type II toxin-antitoxin system Phd/YefM family antitoxin [Deltaproteobacteria bacterium]